MHWRIAMFVATGLLAVGLTAASAVAWLDDHDGEAPEPTVTLSEQELVALGRQVYQRKGCAACHGAPDFPAGGIGPSLFSLSETAGERVPGMSAEEYVRTSILSPDAYLVSGYGAMFGMPRLDVTGEEVDALVAFLLSERGN